MSRRTGSGRSRRRRSAVEPRDPARTSYQVFIERQALDEPVVVELDRPMAFRPRLVGFWRGTQFHVVTRIVTTRREHDVTYLRVLTDRGTFDLRYIRRMDPITLRAWRRWELCAELEAIPVARLG